MKAAVLAGLLLFAVVQAKYEFTQIGKDCIKELGTTEDTMELLVIPEHFDEHNDLLQKFLGCCFRTFISDTNEIIVDDKFTTYITKIFTTKMGGKRKLATLMAEDCIQKCKDVKGNSKQDTACKMFKCLMAKFFELKDEK